MKLKSLTNKDRYGNMFSVEFFEPQESVPLMMLIPEMEEEGYNGAMESNHPGDPKGTDTVPAWLTPGENVVNAEASRIPGNQEMIDQMNDEGRAIQQAQGGPIPTYEADGGQMPAAKIDGNEIAKAAMAVGLPTDNATLNKLVQLINQGYSVKEAAMQISGKATYAAGGSMITPMYAQEGRKVPSWLTDNLLDSLMMTESSGDPSATSEVGAKGLYQIMPSTAVNPGMGVTPLALEDIRDPVKSRAFARDYLAAIAASNPDFTINEVLTAYHSGAGNVRKAKKGTKALGPRGEAYAGKVMAGVEEPSALDKASSLLSQLSNFGMSETNQEIPVPKMVDGVPVLGDTVTETPKPTQNDFLKFFKATNPGTLKVPADMVDPSFEEAFFKSQGGPVYAAEGDRIPFISNIVDYFTKEKEQKPLTPEEESLAMSSFLNPNNQAMLKQKREDAIKQGMMIPNVPDLEIDNTDYSVPLPDSLVPDLEMDNTDYGNVPDNTPPSVERVLDASKVLQQQQRDAQNLSNLRDNAIVQGQINNTKEAIDSQTEKLTSDQERIEMLNKNNIPVPSSLIDSVNSTKEKIAELEAKKAEQESNVPPLEDIPLGVSQGDIDAALNNEQATTTAEDVLDQTKDATPVTPRDAATITGTNDGTDNVNPEEVKTISDKVSGYFKEMFSEMFDGPELARLITTYSASRVLGYDHASSLNFSMKNYVDRVDTNNTAIQEFVTDKDNLENFTTASLEEYRKTGDLTKLVSKTTPISIIEHTGKVYIRGYGQVPTVKLSDKTEGILINGKPQKIDQRIGDSELTWADIMETWNDDIHGEVASQSRMADYASQSVKAANQAAGLEDGKGISDDSKLIGTKASKILNDIMLRNGTSLNQVSALEISVAEAINEFYTAKANAKQKGTKIPMSLDAFIEARIFNPLTGVPQSAISGVPIETIRSLNKNVKEGMDNKNPRDPSYNSEYQEEWQTTWNAWAGLTPEKRNEWIAKAAKKETDNGFTLWMKNTPIE